jgi:hypothetical protein
MKARNRSYGNGRRVALRTRVGVAAAAAALAGGGAIAAAAAASHPGVTRAEPAGYYLTPLGYEWAMLNAAMDNWGRRTQYSYTDLARLSGVREYSQAWQHRQMLAVQRGIVVLATRQFLILRSANGSLHLWLLSGGTRFQDVSSTASGMSALTGNSWAAGQAMDSNNMVPATSWLAGSTSTAASMLAPAAAAQTVTVQVANTDLTVKVTVTASTATVQQTATMPWNGMPWWRPASYRVYAWQAMSHVARGDLALVAGYRSDWVLHARLVLFAPLSSSDVPGTTAPGTQYNGPAQTSAGSTLPNESGSHT